MSLDGSEHRRPQDHVLLGPTDADRLITVILILRRRPGGPALRGTDDFAPGAGAGRAAPTREAFARDHGADPAELALVQAFAGAHGLEVVEAHQARRSVVLRGPAAAVNEAFEVTLLHYGSARGCYYGHEGPPSLPEALADVVEAVVGLTDRPVPAQHHATPPRGGLTDPPGIRLLTPQRVAELYDFPPGDGAGQTIGVFEMQTQDGAAGYAAVDLAHTVGAFGDGLRPPAPIDVSIDGVTNSGVSDGETGLDIAIASAIAPAARIAVYFTGDSAQDVIRALQRMVHPDADDPQPAILSISYDWGPDDAGDDGLSEHEYVAIGQLFQDAANLAITVLVSSGDTGAFVQDRTQAQTAYPASEPWVIACGGTTIGAVGEAGFEEYVWNDTGLIGPGAGGGGVSARFPVPSYQAAAAPPLRNGTRTPGRGVPDVAGNASENSGYVQFVAGRPSAAGGASAVPPLYAGLIARINANLGRPVGFINPILYSLAGQAFRGIVAPPGPTNNSFGRVAGYPARDGWDACTGLGSVIGRALQQGLRAALGQDPAA
ncbi:MAG: S53 family peptidase [Caulobacteraceae bacterium]|nr:S53 family peptidase [Caulobacteraceae bacterium]